MTAMTGASSRNLEDLASLLSVLSLSNPYFTFSDSYEFKRPNQAIELLAECVRKVFSPESNDYTTAAVPMLQRMTEQSNLHVITTNYDMTIEIASMLLGLRVDVSNDILNARLMQEHGRDIDIACMYNSIGSSSDIISFRLNKLHGSLNWFDRNGTLVVDNRVAVGQRNSAGAPIRMDMKFCGNDTDRPLLALPSVIKQNSFDLLSSEWSGAHKALLNADAIWFIGYSFPESDAFMRYFLAGALHGNTRLRQIAIIDPCAHKIIERTRLLFGSPELRGLLESIPMKWENFAAHMPAYLTGHWRPSIADQYIRAMRDEMAGRAVLRGDIDMLDNYGSDQRNVRPRSRRW